ncbi:hypothetical protein [Dactylosporangium sp. CA-139066]|uniref:hypothetical protein n=1 Tax=Dactylosporangium sp. CA-139066 TaxID=3239930 RepID=UPI003D9442B1
MYFFLSHAPPAPLSGSAADPDREVRRFFGDLSRQVRARVGAGAAEPVGFLEAEVRAGADRNAARIRALGSAQVFVPLYSPAYLENAFARGELAAPGRSSRWRTRTTPACSATATRIRSPP